MTRAGTLAQAARTTLKYLLVGIATLVIVIPLLFAVFGAFKTNAQIFSSSFFPRTFYLKNFITVLSQTNTGPVFLNSIIIAAGSILLSVVLCCMAAIPIVRRPEKYFKASYFIFLSSMIIPAISSVVPLYTMMAGLKMTNNIAAVILIFGVRNLPIGILIIAGFVKTVPITYEESARLDGCGYVQRILLIIVPLLKTPILSFMALTFPGIWNDFMTPLLFLQKPKLRTVTLMVYQFTRDHEADHGAVFALIFLGMIIPLAFYSVARKQIDAGIGAQAGGIKG
jgi:ABC-type glycerol-3-phosphate transport system permease component